MTTADRYTDADVAKVGDALDRWLTGLGLPGNHVTACRPYGAARAVLDALTAAGWHPPRTCIQVDLTRLPTEAQAAADPDDTEDVLDRMVAAGWMPNRWAPRAQVAEDIAQAIEQDVTVTSWPGSPASEDGERAAAIARAHTTGGDHE
jgi:hypothetical protein